MLNQPKMLPIRYMPITIELEIVHDPNEPIVSEDSTGSDGFSTANTTQSWQIENVQVKVDVVTLDNQLDIAMLNICSKVKHYLLITKLTFHNCKAC